MAQLVRDERVVLWDRRRDLIYDDAGVREKWGVPPTSIPDWLGLVGDSSDGFPGLPGWGAKSAAAVLTPLRPLRGRSRRRRRRGRCPGVGGSRAVSLAATLRDHWDEALLYRDLARLRTADDGVPIRQTRPRRAALGRRAARRVGGVLRGMGPRPAAVKAPSLARGRADDSGLAGRRSEQRSVVGRRRGEDADRLRARGRGRTTGRRPSR